MENGLFLELERMLERVKKDLNESRSWLEIALGKEHSISSTFYPPEINLTYRSNEESRRCLWKQLLSEVFYGPQNRTLASVKEKGKGLFTALNPNMREIAEIVDSRLNNLSLIKDVRHESFYGCFKHGSLEPLLGKEAPY